MAEKYIIQLEVDSKGAVTNIDELTEAIKNTGKVAEKELKNVDKDLEGVGEGSKDAKKGVSKLDLGFKGLGASMKAAGIGLIVSAFLFLKEALSSNQEVVDVMNVTFQTLNILTKQFTDIVVDNVKVLYKAAQNFGSLGKVIKGVIDIGLFPMRHALLNLEKGFLATQLAWEKSFFGDGDEAKIKQLQEDISGVSLEINELEDGLVESAKSVVDNFGGALSEINEFGKVYTGNFINQFNKLSEISISSAIDQADNLVQLKKNAELARVTNRGLIEDFDRQAEKQRQIRDNDLKSIDDRIAANNNLKETLEEQKKLMLENVKAIQAEAQAQFDLTGKDEDRLKLLEAKNEVKAVEAQIEGFMSEQESNRVALKKEKMALDQVDIDATAERQKRQKEFNIELEQDEIKKLELLKANLEAEKIAETKRLEEKRDAFQQGTQAYVDANNELLDYQQENANEQIKIGNEITKATDIRNQKEIDNDKAVAKAKINMAKSTLGNITKAIGSNSKAGKAASAAAALINTYQGITAELATKTTTPFGFALKLANIATTAAIGFKSVKDILKTNPENASSSVSNPSTGASAPVQEPQFNIVGQGAGSQIASALGEQQQAPIQAFVVSQDVTTAQSLENGIIQGATLGG